MEGLVRAFLSKACETIASRMVPDIDLVQLHEQNIYHQITAGAL